MARRSIVKSPRWRACLSAVATLLLIVAVIGCTMRIAVLWDRHDGDGGVTSHGLILEYGVLAWESNQNSAASQPAMTSIVNWQVEPGFSMTTYSNDTWTYFAPYSISVITTHAFAFSAPLALVATICLILAVRWLPRRPGFCNCGHDLTGLRSNRCPECGKPLADGGR